MNEDNYNAWSLRAGAVLQQRRLWEAISPGYEGIAELTPKQQDKDSDARNFLIQAVEDQYLTDIQHCTTAKEAWEVLREIHCNFGMLHMITMLEEMCTIKKTSNLTMREYMGRIQMSCEKLAKGGLQFSDSAIAAFMLLGLPRPHYEGLIRSIDYNEEQQLSTKVVKAKLILEERRENLDKHHAEEAEAKALALRIRKNFRSHRNESSVINRKEDEEEASKRNVVCFACNKDGHIAKYCPRFNDRNANRRNFYQKTTNDSNQRRGRKVYKNEKAAVCQNYTEDEDSEITENREDDSSARVVKFKALRAKKAPGERKEDRMFMWISDSGATHHMTPFREILEDFDDSTEGVVELADGKYANVKGKGSVTIQICKEYGGWTIQLKEVVYVPDLENNLISLVQLDKKGLEIRIKNGCIKVMDNKGVIIKAINSGSDVYLIKCDSYSVNGQNIKNSNNHMLVNKGMSARRTTLIWHQRFGHMKKLPEVCKITNTNEKCDICIQGKMKRKKFEVSKEETNEILKIVHSDVVGKITPNSLGGAQYFVTFLDDFSRYSEVALIKRKDEVLANFKIFVQKSENIQGITLKALQSDNGGEYTSNEFKQYLNTKGILHRLTIPGTPQQNGKAERLNQTLLNIVRCLLLQSGLPSTFWAEALAAANFIRNRCPTKAIKLQIPYELWSKKKLTADCVNTIKVFGCKAWAHNLEGRKLDAKAIECINLGFQDNMKGHRLWDLNRRKIILSRDVIFEEDNFPFKMKPTKDLQTFSRAGEVEMKINSEDIDRQTENLQNEENRMSQIVEDERDGKEEKEMVVNFSTNEDEGNAHEVRRSTRIRKPKECTCCQIKVNIEEDPLTPEEALTRRDCDKWKEAMKQEIESIKKNGTWTLVKRPKHANVIGCRWIFKIKRDKNGVIDRYKARLVAQGFNQIYGRDYWDTYSPVIRRDSLRILLAISVKQAWQVHHVDVANAYLNSELKNTIYMEQPKYWEEGDNDIVCLLQKSLYGLHQSGKEWNDHLHSVLTTIGLKHCISDPCIYIGNDLILGVYVDDIILVGHLEQIQYVKQELMNKFDTRDLGEATNILGINVTRENPKEIVIDQVNYIKALLSEFNMSEAKGCTTPAVQDNDMEDTSESFDETTYRRAIGQLQYIATCTRPDLSFTINRLSKYSNKPTQKNWQEVKRLMRYLKATQDLKLKYAKDGVTEIYCDADWANDKDDSKSICGFVVILSGGVVSWRSKKQQIIATSTVEAEYISMFETCKQMIWIMELLNEIGLSDYLPKPCKVFVDNQGACDLAVKRIVSERTKHIRIRYHKVKEYVSDGFINFCYVPSENNVSDILTKVLSGPKIKTLLYKLGL
ncbi:Retrovirus-related Pol polyprotein, partial [Rhyzopertha dominica]